MVSWKGERVLAGHVIVSWTLSMCFVWLSNRDRVVGVCGKGKEARDEKCYLLLRTFLHFRSPLRLYIKTYLKEIFVLIFSLSCPI
jgi:hypothetical protein